MTNSNLNNFTRSVDIVVAFKNDNESESLRFYKYNYESGVFEQAAFSKPIVYAKEYYIKNLLSNDINNDGYLDFIITIYDTVKKITVTEVNIFDVNQNAYNHILSKSNTGVFLGDFDGNQ